MNSGQYSDTYIEHLARGPFPGRIDPWAEAGRYFQQIHSGIIGSLLIQMGGTLLKMGYVASTETSLQIAASRKPDVAVSLTRNETNSERYLDYSAAAAAVLAEPGIAIEIEESDLESIHIKTSESNELVTVIEVISPRNKTHIMDMIKYQEERAQLFLEQGINVVEVDTTRSVKRLLEHTLTTRHPYHIAVFISGEPTRVITSEIEEPLKRCAVPLRNEVIAIDLQQAYDFAFQQRIIAPQIESNGHYHEDYLPFPSLLTDTQRNDAIQTVLDWHNTLQQLRES